MVVTFNCSCDLFDRPFERVTFAQTSDPIVQAALFFLITAEFAHRSKQARHSPLPFIYAHTLHDIDTQHVMTTPSGTRYVDLL